MLAILMAATLGIQQPAPAGSPTEVDRLVVTAPPKLTEKQAIKMFVEGVADETGNKRLGRWDRKVCVGVVGMTGPYAQYMLDRVAQRSIEVGLQTGEPGCKPNVMVVLTAEPDALAETLYKRYPQTVSRWDLEMTAGHKALKRFVASDAPVRWWHVTRRVMRDGRPYSPGGYVAVEDVSRIRSNTRDDFDRAIVIIDARKVGKVRFEALSDYVAFVTLAQIDPDASPTVAPSILALFADRQAGREPVSAMTEWDMAYAKGVYSMRRDAYKANAQLWNIRDSMAKAVNPPKQD